VTPFRPWQLALVAVAAASGGLRADSIDDAVAVQMKRHHLPGLSLAVVQDGAVVKARGYGLTGADGSPAVTAETRFQAGSISKSVAALGALRLVESGRLSLDADVNATLKTWHLPENEFTKDSRVTLRLILSHSAGLTVHGFAGYAVGDTVPGLVQVLDGAGNSDPIRVDMIPGSKWRYSGGGYTVMQQMVIDAAGQPFPRFMKENVLDPLGMGSSSFEQPMPSALEAASATGHTSPGKAVPGRWHVYPELAAAGLWTTPSDLARFVIAVQQSYAGRSSPVISGKMTREMLTVQKADDGLGVFLAGEGNSRRFTHNGRDEGFDALMVGYVERGQGAVVMINANDNSSAVARVFEAIADAYSWPDYPRFMPPKPVEDKEPGVTSAVRAVFVQAQGGTFDRALFTPNVGDKVSQALSGPLGSELRELGAIRTVALLKRDSYLTSRNYVYEFACENDAMIVNISYDGEGRISGLYVRPE
jgi:CubicO group peptidase (beta-lactamase class C family)